MNGSLTLLDDNLLYIAFSIFGLSGKNEQKMKFRGRGVVHLPNRSLNHKNQTNAIIAKKGSIKLGTWRSTRWYTLGKSCTSACSATKFSVLIRFWEIISSLTLERKPYSCGQSKVSLWPTVERYHTIVNFVAIQPAQLSQWIDTCRFILKIEGGFLNNITRFSN